MKRIKCSNPECGGVFAHLLDNKTLNIFRARGTKKIGDRFVVVGGDYTVMGTCARCDEKTVVIVKDGKVNEDDLVFKDEERDSNGKQRRTEEDSPEEGDKEEPDGDESGSSEKGSGHPADEEGKSRGIPERKFTIRR